MTAPLPPSSQEGRVKLSAIGEAYADLAMVESSLSGMSLSPWVTPVVNLPLKPPAASTGYVPGSVGTRVNAVAANFSHLGIFNDESVSRLIVEVYAVTVINATGGDLDYNLRRLDGAATGMTFLAWVPAYTDAGTARGTALGRVIRSNNTAAQGTVMTFVHVAAGTQVTFPISGVINNGSLLVVPNLVNTPVHAIWWFRTFPIIRVQR